MDFLKSGYSKFIGDLSSLNPQSILTKLIFIAGSYYIFRKSLALLCWIKKYFLTFEKNFKKEYGDGWVIISGASDGIGKEYSKEFTKRGHKILLIARNEDKLKGVIEELKKIPGYVEAQYIVYDFNRKYVDKDIEELSQKLKKYTEDISILINNVGWSQRDYFNDISYEDINNTINVTLQATVFLTRILLPHMNRKDRKCLLVNNGSGLGRLHMAFSGMYCGAKSFIEAFTSVINQEEYNIDVTYLNTGRVYTNMNKGKEFGKLEVNDYARHSIAQFGNYSFTDGHYWISIEYFLVLNSFLSPLLKYHYHNIRKTRMDKENAEKKLKKTN